MNTRTSNVILTLIDFIPVQLHDQGLLVELQTKLREKHLTSFSNNFNLIDMIDCRLYFENIFEPVYDVQLSRYCSCLVVLSRYSFLIIDQVTNYKSYIIPHSKKVTYFTIEENYNGRGFDALITNDSGHVVKYDLREFIETNGKCQPLWRAKGSYNDRGINVMILELKRVVVVDNGCSLVFYDSKDGLSLSNYNMEIDQLNSSIGVDHRNANSFFALIGSNIERFVYMENEWKISRFMERIPSLADVFVVDKISGFVYYFINPAYGVFKAIVLNGEGELVLEKKLTRGSSGFCIDKWSGKMFVCFNSSILVYE